MVGMRRLSRMRKLTALVAPTLLLALAGCGPSQEGKDAYLEWVNEYRDLMPDMTDKELIGIGETQACTSVRDNGSQGMTDFVIDAIQHPDMITEGAQVIGYAAIVHLCPDVGEEFADPVPQSGEFLGPPS